MKKIDKRLYVIDKLRNSLELISEATRKLIFKKNIKEFLVSFK